mmetsp:Transcript_28185/g.58117  ORF Transcript_28185/g.58117 Transcript_28185/m.58117 type:complete len:118 (+) Transcript_28185:40-393(+)
MGWSVMEEVRTTLSRWERSNARLRKELRQLKSENMILSRLFDDLQEHSQRVRKLEADNANLDLEIQKVQEELALLDSAPELDDTSASEASFREDMERRKIQAFKQKFLLRRDLRMRC